MCLEPLTPELKEELEKEGICVIEKDELAAFDSWNKHFEGDPDNGDNE